MPKAKRTKPKLIWWHVSMLRRKGERLGLVQAPEGDVEAAIATAIEAYTFLTEAEKKRIVVRPAT